MNWLLIRPASLKREHLLRRLFSREAQLDFRHGGRLALDYLKDSAQGSDSNLHLRKAHYDPATQKCRGPADF